MLFRSASFGTAEGFEAAIRATADIGTNSYLSEEAARAVEQWSRSLLSIATERALADPATAIDIARRIPASASIYGSTQLQIANWEAQLRSEAVNISP